MSSLREQEVLLANSQEVNQVDKISKILPTSARIKSVDFSQSGRVRPGLPDFGVPVGKSALAPVDRFSKSDVALKLGKEFTSTDWKVRDLAKASMVEKMNDSFFDSRLNEREDAEEVVAPMFRLPANLAAQSMDEPESYEMIADEEEIEPMLVMVSDDGNVWEVVDEEPATEAPSVMSVYSRTAESEPEASVERTIDYMA